MDFEIIDFHTHPFLSPDENICSHTAHCDMGADKTPGLFAQLGISKICGSVLVRPCASWADIRRANDDALRLRDLYGAFYVPGFHVHPDYVDESCAEIARMASEGVRLIGELVPYMHGWTDYSCPAFSTILDEATRQGMVVSFHSMGEDEMDAMVLAHPDTVFVAAHPGEFTAFSRHMKRMATSANYYLDLSGTGLFRHGMLRHAIDDFGPERFLFGSDFPTCNPAMFVGGVALEPLLSDEEKRLVLAGNARRLLGLSPQQ
jgi:predicted TIM-barrel fold metal-dependent hydrolase